MLVLVESGVKSEHNMKRFDDTIRDSWMYRNIKDVTGYSTIFG